MIGQYLALVTPAQEDRILTTRLAYAPAYVRTDGCRCLVGAVTDKRRPWGEAHDRSGPYLYSDCRTFGAYSYFGVGGWFDELCLRFGEVRVNAAIRSRILRNRLRSELAGVREAVQVEPHHVTTEGR